jgi:uncharacterized protein (TIGR02246 family)
MRLMYSLVFTAWLASLFVANLQPAAAQPRVPTNSQDGKIEGEVRDTTTRLVSAFNAGKSDEVAGLFLENGELIDERGNVYHGTGEIKAVLDQYIQKFPGAKATIEIESLRVVGPVVIQDGTRTTVHDATSSVVQFTTVFAKTAQGWRIASMRDFPEQTRPTPGELLQSLAWLEGEWVNEGTDARVKISYRWSEDKNFLLGDFTVLKDGKAAMKTSQRIAWDPLLGKPRSWLFDSDGGFSEAVWTRLEDGRWIIRSSAVLPDGTTGSANVTITPAGETRFIYAGSSRLIGEKLEDDFELNIVRRPPAAIGK